MLSHIISYLKPSKSMVLLTQSSETSKPTPWVSSFHGCPVLHPSLSWVIEQPPVNITNTCFLPEETWEAYPEGRNGHQATSALHQGRALKQQVESSDSQPLCHWGMHVWLIRNNHIHSAFSSWNSLALPTMAGNNLHYRVQDGVKGNK